MSHPVFLPVDQRFAIDWVDTIDLLVDVYSVQVFDTLKIIFTSMNLFLLRALTLFYFM